MSARFGVPLGSLLLLVALASVVRAEPLADVGGPTSRDGTSEEAQRREGLALSDEDYLNSDREFENLLMRMKDQAERAPIKEDPRNYLGDNADMDTILALIGESESINQAEQQREQEDEHHRQEDQHVEQNVAEQQAEPQTPNESQPEAQPEEVQQQQYVRHDRHRPYPDQHFKLQPEQERHLKAQQERHRRRRRQQQQQQQQPSQTGEILEGSSLELSPERGPLPAGSSDDDDDECPICYDSLDEMPTGKLECGHEFHKKCLLGWIRTKARNAELGGVMSCPVCRHKHDFRRAPISFDYSQL